jgi:DNA-binding MarR family transcriptional regulator
MSTSDFPSLPPPQVGALLRTAWEELQDEMFPRLVAAGFDDLRPAHTPLLRRILADGLRPTELAERLGLSKQTVNGLLREFEAKGYLTLEPDPDDGRAKRIALTERGWSLVTTGARLSAELGDRWAARIGKRRYAEFEAVLREIVEGESPTPVD